MKEYYDNDFSSPDTLKRIQEKEKSPETREKLSAIKDKMKGKKTETFDYRLLIAGFIGLLLIGTRYYSLFVIGLVCYFKFFRAPDKVDHDISGDYVDGFVNPILDEIFPGTRVDYDDGLEESDFDKIFPRAYSYESNCHISFKDEYETQLFNLEARAQDRNSKGNIIYRTDFGGQVLLMNFKTKSTGHVRIVPLKFRNEYGPHMDISYGKIRDGEREIFTESIDFNNAYGVFATDELGAKKILDPNIINIMNTWIGRTGLWLYVDEDGLMMGFRSRSNIFTPPTKKSEIEKLSLSGEYDKFRMDLGYYYGFMELIRKKL